VTGASRGIGKACSVSLARAGFDVAITARTVQPGEEREHSPTLKKSDTRPLPGSLAETAALVEAEGARALMVPADLLDRASLGAAVATVLERWGRVDLLLNNGRYIGPGHMDVFVDTPIDLLDAHVQANVMAPLVLTKLVLPNMLERGSGILVNMTSTAAMAVPHAPTVGAGGWGMGYGLSKAAFHRVAGFLATELGDRGILTYNVQPGYISTERIAIDMGGFGFGDTGEPPEVVGEVVAWLATNPEAAALTGQNIEAQYFCHDKGLLPGWGGPRYNTFGLRWDHSGAIADELNQGLLA
jgi:NAD(P)-dependent dehydrogenase (short-subunit alcohol dehydrogenase family)